MNSEMKSMPCHHTNHSKYESYIINILLAIISWRKMHHILINTKIDERNENEINTLTIRKSAAKPTAFM